MSYPFFIMDYQGPAMDHAVAPLSLPVTGGRFVDFTVSVDIPGIGRVEGRGWTEADAWDALAHAVRARVTPDADDPLNLKD